MSPGPTSHAPKTYPPILPGHTEWPVVRLSKNRKNFITAVIEQTLDRLLNNGLGPQNLIEELEMNQFK